MRKYLNEETRAIFDRYLCAAVNAGCDVRQAENIAKERTLFDVMRSSACAFAVRDGLNRNALPYVPPNYKGPSMAAFAMFGAKQLAAE